MREFLPDGSGTHVVGFPANNKVGYFYMAPAGESAKN